MKNPTQPKNEDFQTSQIRSFAEAIYIGAEDKLVQVIVDTLGLGEDKDSEGNPIKMDFEYAYTKLVEAGYNITHQYVENGGTCTLEVKIYKLATTQTFDVKTTFSAIYS